MAKITHTIDPLASDLAREHRSEPVPPHAGGSVTDVDATLEQEVLDVPQRQGERTYIKTTGRIASGELT
ncbi:hypothetical protein [Sphingomonas sp. Leaf412]|uniref:hypothetical protein n=1 Tax=Sphingomonas sp. Leaf412 TaxID=1736370 RepID=UPI001F462FDB|nr:hypothetical protein [Sphingomonas sp. Leaf412]